MKNYVWIVRTLFIVTLVSFVLLFLTKCTFYDIMLAIFGSSFVSLIISVIGYFTAKTETLEDFYHSVSERLHYWTLYDSNDSIEEKCEYFMSYYIKEFSDIGRNYSKIYFLFDCKQKEKIYNDIYIPCSDLNNSIINYYWNLKWHLDGTGRNEKIITEIIKELENKMIDSKNGKDYIINIQEQLNGFYLDILNNRLKYYFKNRINGKDKDF